MQEPSKDWQLLQEYVHLGSHEAFARLVNAYAGMVYAASVRQVRDRAMADDVTQAVFITLSRKAHRLTSQTLLGPWLYQTVRYASLNALKQQARRRRHERRALTLQAAAETDRLDDVWQQLSPTLDDALASLREKDRHAIVLRFFQHLSMADIGRAFGVSEDAAQMRVARALGRLRELFARRGILGSERGLVTAVVLGTLLASRAAPAAPASVIQHAVCRAAPGGEAAGTTVARPRHPSESSRTAHGSSSSHAGAGATNDRVADLSTAIDRWFLRVHLRHMATSAAAILFGLATLVGFGYGIAPLVRSKLIPTTPTAQQVEAAVVHRQ